MFPHIYDKLAKDMGFADPNVLLDGLKANGNLKHDNQKQIKKLFLQKRKPSYEKRFYLINLTVPEVIIAYVLYMMGTFWQIIIRAHWITLIQTVQIHVR